VKVVNLTQGSKVYTSNVYLVTGTWNTPADVNTLIDVGRDPVVIDKINQASTGVGKKRVQQVILTHSHYDHVSLLPRIREEFNPEVCAFSPSLKGVDRLIKDGDLLKIGDGEVEVIYTPCHSNDSVCLYCPQDGILFSGDTPVIIHSADGTYERMFYESMRRICQKDIRSIFFGHGEPMTTRCNERLQMSLDFVRKSVSPDRK